MKLQQHVIPAFKALFISVCLLLLAACDETHPDDLPGGVNNPYPLLQVEAESSVAIPANEDTLTFPVAVNLSNPAPEDGEVRYRLVPNTAHEGRDYEVGENSIEFVEDSRQIQIPVELINDQERSEAREFILELTGATNATLGVQVSHTIILEPIERGNDGSGTEQATLNLPTELAFTAPPAGTYDFSIVIPFSRELTSSGSVEIRTIQGTALEGVHYQGISGTNCSSNVCSAEPGHGELTFFITIDGDQDRADRSFRLQFLNAEGFTLPEQREVNVTLSYSDSSTSSSPELLVSDSLNFRMPTASRGSISYPVVFALSETLTEDVSIEWRTVEGSALANTHFTPIDSTGSNAQILPAGNREFEFEIELMHDSAMTENRQFEIQLVASDGVDLPESRTIQVEVINSNSESSEPLITVPGAQVFHEPMNASQQYTIRLPLSERVTQNASVDVTFVEGSAKAGIHYSAFDGEISLSEGSSEVEIPLTLMADSATSTAIEFRIELYNAVGIALPATRSFSVQIEDNGAQAPEPLLVLAPSLVRVPTPRDGVAEQVSVVFELSEPLPEDASINIRSQNGSASAGIEFDEVDLVNQFVPSGSSIISIPLNLLPVALSGSKEFELVFYNPRGITLPENRSVTVQIDPIDTPAIPTLSIPDTVNLVAPEDAAAEKNRTIVLPFSGQAPLPGQLSVIAQNRTAIEGEDFALTSSVVGFEVTDTEALIELELEPTTANIDFEIIFTASQNVSLPEDAAERVLPVNIEAF